jgi:protein disulfide-isomerase
LNREILSTDEFKEYAGKKLILVELDFPRGKPQSNDVKEQNAKLADRFKIEGYPTVIVLNSSGKKIGELGYQEGGPSPFVEALSKM